MSQWWNEPRPHLNIKTIFPDIEIHIIKIRLRDYFVNVPSQWDMVLHCNVISHWLGANTKWSLRHSGHCLIFIMGIHTEVEGHILVKWPQGTIGCHTDLWCQQWQQSWHHNNSIFSVVQSGSSLLLKVLSAKHTIPEPLKFKQGAKVDVSKPCHRKMKLILTEPKPGHCWVCRCPNTRGPFY